MQIDIVEQFTQDTPCTKQAHITLYGNKQNACLHITKKSITALFFEQS